MCPELPHLRRFVCSIVGPCWKAGVCSPAAGGLAREAQACAIVGQHRIAGLIPVFDPPFDADGLARVVPGQVFRVTLVAHHELPLPEEGALPDPVSALAQRHRSAANPSAAPPSARGTGGASPLQGTGHAGLEGHVDSLSFFKCCCLLGTLLSLHLRSVADAVCGWQACSCLVGLAALLRRGLCLGQAPPCLRSCLRAWVLWAILLRADVNGAVHLAPVPPLDGPRAPVCLQARAAQALSLQSLLPGPAVGALSTAPPLRVAQALPVALVRCGTLTPPVGRQAVEIQAHPSCLQAR